MREAEHEVEWISVDGSTHEKLTMGWESGGWTADGVITGLDIQYAIRTDDHFKVRQFLLFRDLADADLWLASDGGGRWGEVNGSHRADLDGCIDLDMMCTPFTSTLPIRRLSLHVGDTAEIIVALVDPVTLEVVPQRQRYARTSEFGWHFETYDGATTKFDVDEHGLIVDCPGYFQRVSS